MAAYAAVAGVHAELVVVGNVVTIGVFDENNKPTSAKGFSGSVLIVSGGNRETVTLAVAGDNSLKGEAKTAVPAGAAVTLVLKNGRASPAKSNSETWRLAAMGVTTCYNIAMKVAIRRIGNSLGVIVPKPVLEAWGVGEGDRLDVTARGIQPAAQRGLSHQALDELKRSIALAVVRRFTPNQIRAQILANLHRWRRQGVWASAYDEWKGIAERADDGELFAAMLGVDDNAMRLRQSMPFVGLLSREEVRRLHEEAAG